MAQDFISDEEMAAMDTKSQPQTQSTPNADFISDADMEAMGSIDYDAAEAEVTKVIERGGTAADVRAVTDRYGIDPNSYAGTNDAIAFRQKHGRYGGTVTLRPVDPMNPAPEPVKHVVEHEDKGAGNAAVLGGIDGVTFGSGDEIGAFLDAGVNSIEGAFGGGNGQDFGDFYAERRDQYRDDLANAQADHPVAFGVGQVAGGVATAPIGGGAASLGRLAVRGGVGGAVYGFNSADGDIGSRLYGAGSGALVGAAGAGAVGGLGRVASPTVNSTVRRLLDAGVRMTPGQMGRASGGLIGRAVSEAEDLATSLPFMGSAIDRAQTRAKQDYTQFVADQALSHVSNDAALRRQFFSMQRPERVIEATKDLIGQVGDSATTTKGIAAAVRGLDEIDMVAKAATDGIVDPAKLAANPQNNMSVALSGIADDGVDAFAPGAVAFTNGATSKATSYLEKLLGPMAPKIIRGGTGIAALSQLGPAAIPGIAAGTALYSKTGQRLAQSVIAGRQGAVAKGIRKGAETLAPQLSPTYQAEYNQRQRTIPNIGVK